MPAGQQETPWTIHFYDIGKHRDTRWPPIKGRSAALHQACNLMDQACTIQRIVSDDGQEIHLAEIGNYLRTRHRR